VSDVARLRGEGRWAEALEHAGDDPLLRADLLNEQALFAGSAEARELAARELDRAEARLEAERGRILHARFLAERGAEDPQGLEHFEASLELARREAEVEARREVLAAAARDRQAIDKLKERRKAEHEAEWARRSQNTLDELALAVHRRGGAVTA
jgi:flagellar FliJ protein